MNTILLILLILIVLMTMSRTEMFTEQFGFSGYTKPIKPVLLKGTDTDLSDYEESVKKLKYRMISCRNGSCNKQRSF